MCDTIQNVCAPCTVKEATSGVDLLLKYDQRPLLHIIIIIPCHSTLLFLLS